MKALSLYLYAIGVSIGSVCAYFGIEPMVIVVLTVCFSFDFLTGMYAAKKKETYKSSKGREMTITKILGIIAILIMALIFRALHVPHEYFTLSALMLLSVHDLISSLRHIYYLRTKKDLGEFDAISALIKTMSNSLKKLAKTILKLDE